MGASEISAGKAFLELLISDKEFAKGLESATRKLDDFGKRALAVGASIASVGALITAPFVESLRIFAETGEQLEKMSQRTGISVEALSELKFAAQQSGTDLESLEGTIRKMQKTISAAAGGSSEAAEALAAIGVSVAELKGLTPDEQFSKIAAGIRLVVDPTERAADAMKIFGKSGTSVIPLIEHLDELRQKARDLGVTIDEKTAQSAAKLKEAFNALSQQATAVSVAIAAAVAPQVTALAEALSSTLPVIIDWIHNNALAVEAVAALGVALTVLGTTIAAIGAGLVVLIPAMTALGAAVTPAGVAVTGLTAGLLYLVGQSGAIGAAIDAITTHFHSLAKEASDAMGYLKAAKELGDAFRNTKPPAGPGDDPNAGLKARIADNRRRFGNPFGVGPDLIEAQKNFPAQADTLFHNILSTLPVAIQQAFSGAKLPSALEDGFKTIGEAIGHISNLGAGNGKFLDEQAEANAKLIYQQAESFRRPLRGGEGGAFAQQIAGTTAAQAREERHFKLQQDVAKDIAAIKAALLKGKPILIGGH